MKSLLIVMAMFCVANVTVGQGNLNKPNIQWGKEHKQSKRMTLSDIVGYDKTGIYSIQSKMNGKMKGAVLEHFDAKLNHTKSVDLELKTKNQERSFESIVQMNGKLYLFSSFRNLKIDKNVLFVQTIDKAKLSPLPDLKVAAEIDISGSPGKHNIGSFTTLLSRDSSHLLVYYQLPYKKKEVERFGFHVFDKNMKEVWNRSVELPYEENLYQVQDYKVDDYGNVHLLGRLFKEKVKESSGGKPNYNYNILSYFSDSKDVKEYAVNVDGKYLVEMQIAINDQRDIIAAGFYSDEGKSGIIGTYFVKIDAKTRKIVTKTFKEFSLDFITQNLSDRKEKKTIKKAERGGDVELDEYDLDNLILKDDGGVMLVGEQYFVNVSTTTSQTSTGTTTSTRYYYSYNDVIVINISANGTILWAEKIAKRQTTVNDGGFFSSYALAVVNDKLNFIFNDHLKNIGYKGEGKVHNFTGGKGDIVSLVEIDNDGKQTRKPLFFGADAEVIIRPKVCEQISDNEIVLFGQYRKGQRFCKVTFK